MTTSNGHGFRDRVASYVLTQFGAGGIVVYSEVNVGKSIIGKNRIIDLLALRPSDHKALYLECKSQSVPGTTDEKIYYSLADLEAASTHAPVCLVYAGNGWSPGVLHTLEASPIAAACDPLAPFDRTARTRELDYVIAAVFGLWDMVLPDRRRFQLGRPPVARARRAR